MSTFGSNERTSPAFPSFDTPALPPAAFAGVRSRRMLAFGLDFLLVSLLAMLIWCALFVATFGLAAFVLPPLWPIVAFFYNGLTVAGPRMATPGMRLLDLEMRSPIGERIGFVTAGVHGALLYLSWLFPPVFLVALVAPDKRCLHDIVAGVIVVRRPY